MQPNEQFGTTTSSDPLSGGRVDVGMVVVDASGDEVGTVSAVQAPGTDVRPDTVAGIAEVLMGTGYLRIDGTGALSNDAYASGDQIADTGDGVVRLHVGRDDLHRSAS